MLDLFDGIVPFVLTARARSFRAAAAQLGVTPAAVSKAVKRLEAEVGATLLHRTTRKVSLSEEGAQFLERCEDAIAHVQAGRDLVAAAQRAPRGELVVSLSYVLGRPLVAALPRFLARYPALRVELRLTDRRSRLVDERIDVALRVGPLGDSSLVARRLLEPRWVTVAAPDYLARAGTPTAPEELVDHACIRFRSPRGKPVPWSFGDGAAGPPRSLDVPGRVDLDQGELIVAAAAAGAGIAQVFDFMAAPLLRSGRLVEVLGDLAAPGPAVYALVLGGRRRAPKVRAFLDFVGEALGPG
ncbi:MAG: LysR family transcriptional regulator [Myxococcales bacterium]|nr:LysR family transcriptional regulator [Myxococcales bacterium]